MRKRNKTPLPGYPKEFIFESREQIDAYLSGSSVTCMQCGRDYRILETHLRFAHSLTGDDYRERYGLPFGRGLCAADFSEQRSAHGASLYAENKDRQDAALAKAKAVQAEHGNAQRSKPKYWKNERTKYTRTTYNEFVRRVLSGRAVSDVQNDIDMPTTTNVYWYMERDKDFAKEWARLVAPVAKLGTRVKDRPTFPHPIQA